MQEILKVWNYTHNNLHFLFRLINLIILLLIILLLVLYFLISLMYLRKISTENSADIYFHALGNVLVVVLAERMFQFVPISHTKISRWNLAGKFGLHCGCEDHERWSRFRHARINCTRNSILTKQQFTEQTDLISRSGTFLVQIT